MLNVAFYNVVDCCSQKYLWICDVKCSILQCCWLLFQKCLWVCKNYIFKSLFFCLCYRQGCPWSSPPSPPIKKIFLESFFFNLSSSLSCRADTKKRKKLPLKCYRKEREREKLDAAWGGCYWEDVHSPRRERDAQAIKMMLKEKKKKQSKLVQQMQVFFFKISLWHFSAKFWDFSSLTDIGKRSQINTEQG